MASSFSDKAPDTLISFSETKSEWLKTSEFIYCVLLHSSSGRCEERVYPNSLAHIQDTLRNPKDVSRNNLAAILCSSVCTRHERLLEGTSLVEIWLKEVLSTQVLTVDMEELSPGPPALDGSQLSTSSVPQTRIQPERESKRKGSASSAKITSSSSTTRRNSIGPIGKVSTATPMRVTTPRSLPTKGKKRKAVNGVDLNNITPTKPGPSSTRTQPPQARHASAPSVTNNAAPKIRRLKGIHQEAAHSDPVLATGSFDSKAGRTSTPKRINMPELYLSSQEPDESPPPVLQRSPGRNSPGNTSTDEDDNSPNDDDDDDGYTDIDNIDNTDNIDNIDDSNIDDSNVDDTNIDNSNIDNSNIDNIDNRNNSNSNNMHLSPVLIAQRKPHEVHAALVNLIRSNLPPSKSVDNDDPKKNNVGYVYIFTNAEADDAAIPHPLKIGKSTDTDSRRRNLKSSCGIPLNIADTRLPPIPNAPRVEKLAQFELGLLLARPACRPDCKTKKHREWFAVDEDEAKRVVKRWADFLACEPYETHGNGRLKDYWVWRLRRVQVCLEGEGHENVAARHLRWGRFVQTTWIDRVKFRLWDLRHKGVPGKILDARWEISNLVLAAAPLSTWLLPHWWNVTITVFLWYLLEKLVLPLFF